MNMTERYAHRRDLLRPFVAKAGLSALLVSHAANRFYLSGFELHDPQCNESSGLLLIDAEDPERDRLLTDPRYADAAKRLWDEDKLFIYSGNSLEMIRSFLWERVPAAGPPLGVESKSMNVNTFTELGKEVNLEPCAGLVERLRLIKEDFELEAMRRSCMLNHAVFQAVPGLLKPGSTEKEIAWEIEKLFREQGASELSFSTIVGVGPNGALPHAIPGQDKVLNECPVLVDMGGRLEDYCSDQTRTFWVGEKPTDEFKRTMDLVRGAQEKAIKDLEPGMSTSELYQVARDYLEEHGQAQYFTHGLGHGIGLETHEPPSVSPVAHTILEPGMVITIEPGLYYPEWGGIRWEYMVHVTDDGAEVF